MKQRRKRWGREGKRGRRRCNNASKNLPVLEENLGKFYLQKFDHLRKVLSCRINAQGGYSRERSPMPSSFVTAIPLTEIRLSSQISIYRLDKCHLDRSSNFNSFCNHFPLHKRTRRKFQVYGFALKLKSPFN